VEARPAGDVTPGTVVDDEGGTVVDGPDDANGHGSPTECADEANTTGIGGELSQTSVGVGDRDSCSPVHVAPVDDYSSIPEYAGARNQVWSHRDSTASSVIRSVRADLSHGSDAVTEIRSAVLAFRRSLCVHLTMYPALIFSPPQPTPYARAYRRRHKSRITLQV